MFEQAPGNLAAAVLRGDADRRQMRGVVFVYHHKGKADQLIQRCHHAVAQCPRFVQKILKSVFRVVIAARKAAKIKPQNLGQMIQRQRANIILGQRRRNDRLRPGGIDRNKKISDCLQNSHKKWRVESSELKSYISDSPLSTLYSSLST